MADGVAERRERFEAIYRELYAPICGSTSIYETVGGTIFVTLRGPRG